MLWVILFQKTNYLTYVMLVGDVSFVYVSEVNKANAWHKVPSEQNERYPIYKELPNINRLFKSNGRF